MKRIAPELESLMWTLAEEGNERAIDEFGARHPELRSELLHRIKMVSGLRGEKKRTVEPTKPIPRFVPRAVETRGPIYLVGGLVLAALCALAFLVTILLSPTPHVAPKDNPAPKSTVVTTAPPEQIQPPVNQVAKISPPTPEQVEQDKGLKQGTLRIEHAPLLTVLQMMAAVCGVRIDPAPGMPNPDVVVDYRDMNAMEMLRDLGKQYSFTPLDQHDGSILVVPVVDPNAHAQAEGQVGEIRDKKIGG